MANFHVFFGCGCKSSRIELRCVRLEALTSSRFTTHRSLSLVPIVSAKNFEHELTCVYSFIFVQLFYLPFFLASFPSSTMQKMPAKNHSTSISIPVPTFADLEKFHILTVYFYYYSFTYSIKLPTCLLPCALFFISAFYFLKKIDSYVFSQKCIHHLAVDMSVMDGVAKM